MTPEEQLAKILKQNQNIVFGKTIGTDADGNCTVQTGESSILARSGGQISAGDCVAMKADDGQWYAVSSRVTGTVATKTLYRTRRKPSSTSVETQIIFLFQKDETTVVGGVDKTVTKLYVGGNRGEPEEVYELEAGYTFWQSPTLNKSDTGLDDYIINFVLKGVVYKFCTIQGGELSELKYLPTGTGSSGGVVDAYSFNHGFFNSITVLDYSKSVGKPKISAAGLYMVVTYNTPTFWGAARESPVGSMSKTYRLSTDPEATYVTTNPFGGTIRVNGSVIQGLTFVNAGSVTSEIYCVGSSGEPTQAFDITFNPFAELAGGSGWYLYIDYIDIVGGEAVLSREYSRVSSDLSKHVGLVPYRDGTVDLYADNVVVSTYNLADTSDRAISFISYPFRVGETASQPAYDACFLEDTISNYQGDFVNPKYNLDVQNNISVYQINTTAPDTLVAQYATDNVGLELITIENIPYPAGSNSGSSTLINRTVVWLPEKNFILRTLSNTTLLGEGINAGQTIQALPPSAFRLVDCRAGVLKPYLNDKALRVTFNTLLLAQEFYPQTESTIVECIAVYPLRPNPDRRYYANAPSSGGTEGLVEDITFTGQFYFYPPPNSSERSMYYADFELYDEFGNARTFSQQNGGGAANRRPLSSEEIITKIELVGSYSSIKDENYDNFEVRTFSLNLAEDTQVAQIRPPNEVITTETEATNTVAASIIPFEIIPSVSIDLSGNPPLENPILTGKDGLSALYNISTFDYNTNKSLTSPNFTTSEDPPVIFGENAFKTPTDLFPPLANGNADPRNGKSIFSFKQPNLIDNTIYSVTTPTDLAEIDDLVDVVVVNIESPPNFTVEGVAVVGIPDDFKASIIDASAFLD